MTHFHPNHPLIKGSPPAAGFTRPCAGSGTVIPNAQKSGNGGEEGRQRETSGEKEKERRCGEGEERDVKTQRDTEGLSASKGVAVGMDRWGENVKS